MGTDGQAAARTMLGFGTWRAGYCLECVWNAYKANGASTDRGAPSAALGWDRSDDKHPGDRNPPPGVPVWWGRRYDGNTDGDVVISLGGGRVVATDWPYNGVIGVTTIDERERQIGRSYLGWTGDILGSPINYPGGDNVGTIDNTADNKQVIKDAIFEFFDGAGGRGTDGWKFVRDGVFGQLIQAQDADGYPLFYKSATDRTTTRTNTGLPVRFTAGGFIASTNAQLNEMRRNGVAFTLTPEQTASISSNIAERLATVVSGATPEEVRSIIQDALAGLSLQAVAAS